MSHGSAMSSLRDNVNNTLKKSLEKAHLRWRGTKRDMIFRTSSERRSFFSNAQHRQEVVLGPQVCVLLQLQLEFGSKWSCCAGEQ